VWRVRARVGSVGDGVIVVGGDFSKSKWRRSGQCPERRSPSGTSGPRNRLLLDEQLSHRHVARLVPEGSGSRGEEERTLGFLVEGETERAGEASRSGAADPVRTLRSSEDIRWTKSSISAAM
jgi:hypothetical protein